jgi:hypothetical protein
MARGEPLAAKKVAERLEAEVIFSDSAETSYEARKSAVMALADTLTRRGHVDEALDLLIRASDEAGVLPQYDWLSLSPALDPERDDPRFEALLAKARARFEGVLEVIDSARARDEIPSYLERRSPIFSRGWTWGSLLTSPASSPSPETERGSSPTPWTPPRGGRRAGS